MSKTNTPKSNGLVIMIILLSIIMAAEFAFIIYYIRADNWQPIAKYVDVIGIFNTGLLVLGMILFIATEPKTTPNK